MKPEWCPQWAWDEAKVAAHEYLRDVRLGLATKMTTKPLPLYEHIARALLDAHQRGRREGMEEAAEIARCAFDDRPRRDSMDWNDGFDDGTKAAEYAIRAKAQEVTE